MSEVVEATQLAISTLLGFIDKLADIDDVILNTAGAAVGYVGFPLIRLVRERKADIPAARSRTGSV